MTGLRDMVIEVTPQPTRDPKIAVFNGLKMATSTELSARVLDLIGDRAAWAALPEHTAEWLALQAEVATPAHPRHHDLRVVLARRGGGNFALYSFAGRNANQTLGLLLTHRMEQAKLAPLGFVATDYALLIWSLDPVRDPDPLLDPEGLRDGMETWLAENAVMKAHLPRGRHRFGAVAAQTCRGSANPASRRHFPATSCMTRCANSTPITCCYASPSKNRCAVWQISGG